MCKTDRFWSKVDKTGDCWMWTAAVSSRGYGVFGVAVGKIVLAHRYAYSITYGEIPRGALVRHKCDVRLCCNPEHLETGTAQDNSNDMVNRGRVRLGEDSGMAVLSDQEVREIRTKYVPRVVTQQMLANEYGVDQSLISRIIHRKLWRHL